MRGLVPKIVEWIGWFCVFGLCGIGLAVGWGFVSREYHIWYLTTQGIKQKVALCIVKGIGCEGRLEI